MHPKVFSPTGRYPDRLVMASTSMITAPEATRADNMNDKVWPGLFHEGRATWNTNTNDVMATQIAAMKAAIAMGFMLLKRLSSVAALVSCTVKVTPMTT